MDVQITARIDHPSEGNTIMISVRDVRPEHVAKHGSHGAHVYDYRFSAASGNPDHWLEDALNSALLSIKEGHHNFWWASEEGVN